MNKETKKEIMETIVVGCAQVDTTWMAYKLMEVARGKKTSRK